MRVLRPSTHRRRGATSAGTRAMMLAVALVLAAPRSADAQLLFHLTSSGGEMGVELQADQSGYVGDRLSQQGNQQYWLRLPFNGVLFNPRVFNYSLVLRPLVGWQRVVDRPGSFASKRLGLDFGASLFDGLPVGMLYTVNRTAGSMVGSRATNGHSGTFSQGGTLRIDDRPFPLTVRFLTRSVDDLVEIGSSVGLTRRDEGLRTVELNGQSSKLVLNLVRTAFTDKLGNLSFSSSEGEATHTRRWGRASSIQTTFGTSNRLGNGPYQRWMWSERLTVRHSDAANSNLYVMQRNLTADGVGSANTSAGFATRYQVRPWLGTALDASQLVSIYDRGRLNATSIAPRLTYTAVLPFGAVISGAAAVTMEREHRDFSDVTWLPVTDERHRAVEVSRPTTLLFAHADSASVRVHSVDNTFAFVRELDFRIVQVGQDVQFFVIPGGRIKVGDELLVSYRYNLVGGRERRTIGESFDANISLGGVTLRHSASRRSISSPDDPFAALNGSTDISTMLSVRRPEPFGALDLQLERRTRDQSAVRYLTEEIRIALLPPSNTTLQTSFGVSASRSRNADRLSTLISSRGTVNWMATSSARLQSSLESWKWTYTDAAPDRILGASTELDAQFGRIESEWRYAFQQRSSTRMGRQHRFSARIVRRF